MIDMRFILYKDANNLYESAASEYLPLLGFKSLTQDETDELDMSRIC